MFRVYKSNEVLNRVVLNSIPTFNSCFSSHLRSGFAALVLLVETFVEVTLISLPSKNNPLSRGNDPVTPYPTLTLNSSTLFKFR